MRMARVGSALAGGGAIVALALSACGGSSGSLATLAHTTTSRSSAGKARASARSSTRHTTPRPASKSSTIARMLGQLIVGRFSGAAPPAAFLDQIRSGELGGVILFTENVAAGPTATRDLDEQLQRAATEGGNPPLLIMTDQEGGEVKRLAWAPPRMAAAEMPSGAVARAEGEATGRAMRAVGINVDLAPVADTVHVARSFLHTRSFGSDPASVAERACGFANGIASQGVAYTLKHFPGLGRALTNTDVQPTTVDASASALREDYLPYRECAGNADALVMVNSAIYPSLTGTKTPAVMSPEIYKTELPMATSATPVTISDDLQAAALVKEDRPAQRALTAGLDILLYAQSAEAALDAFVKLRVVAESGGIPSSRIEQAYQAVEGLKVRVAGAQPPATQGGSTASSPGEGASYPGGPETIKPE